MAKHLALLRDLGGSRIRDEGMKYWANRVHVILDSWTHTELEQHHSQTHICKRREGESVEKGTAKANPTQEWGKLALLLHRIMRVVVFLW